MTGRAWRLADRELAAHRAQSAAVALAVGLMLGVLIAALAVVRGLEQICVTAAGAATGGQVYLLADLDVADGAAEIAAHVQVQGGRVLAANAAELQELGGLPTGAAGTVVAFASVTDAAAYRQEMLATFSGEHYQDTELFTEQLSVYDGWQNFDADFLTPAFWVGLVATLLVAVCIFSYVLLGRTQTLARYRTLGASHGQLVEIFGVYLLALSGLTLVAAFLAALLLAAVASLAFGVWLEPQSGICAEAFSGGRWLWGWDWRMLMVLILPLVATGGTLLLNLDQFFDHKLSRRIKEQL